MGLLAEKRHQLILQKLQSTGRIEVTSLARELDVTEVTIRRDLRALQSKGLLRKTYGGAVLDGLPEFNPSVKFRQTKNLNAKRIIGKLASTLIQDGDVIYLEGGSTCCEIIPHLQHHQNLTIIINSLYLLSRLHEYPRHKVIVTGGQYRPEYMDMLGPTAETAISQLSGFKAFTSADDISIEAGISGADVATVSFTKLVLKQACAIFFVGDRSKFDNPALYKIADLDSLDAIITDTTPAGQWQTAAEKKNIQLICTSPD